MAKKAKIQISAVWATCPACGGDLVEEGGSMAIPIGQYNKDSLFECNDCGELFQLEAKAWR